MGTLLIGKQGSGKTSFLAKHLVEKFKNRPLEAVFVLDWSGSITDRILSLILQEETSIRSELLKRVIYDELGNPEWVKSVPEFSPEYGNGIDEQINRVRENWVKLTDFLTKKATILGGVAIKGL